MIDGPSNPLVFNANDETLVSATRTELRWDFIRQDMKKKEPRFMQYRDYRCDKLELTLTMITQAIDRNVERKWTRSIRKSCCLAQRRQGETRHGLCGPPRDGS